MIGLVPQELHTDAFETVWATTTFSLRHWRPGAEIDLGFFAGLDLDPPHSLGLCLAELTHETFDRLIGTAESDFADQILINPLRTQPGFQLGFDAFAMSITETGPARFGLQRRTDQVRTARFAGGRNGGF